jgi:hypothetical protein
MHAIWEEGLCVVLYPSRFVNFCKAIAVVLLQATRVAVSRHHRTGKPTTGILYRLVAVDDDDQNSSPATAASISCGAHHHRWVISSVTLTLTVTKV